ncbi:hypothetical protein JW777_01835 [bacterium]|nr:hypothetical protein [bacterium]
MPSYAYTVLCIPFLVLWAFLYARNPALRKHLFWMSALLGIAGPIAEFWHTRDYWNPGYLAPVKIGPWRFGLEDYILTFAMAGIAFVLFERIYTGRGADPLPEWRWKTLFCLDMAGNAGILCMAFFIYILKINSIYALISSIAAASLVLFGRRREWLPAAALAASIYALGYLLFFRLFMMPLFPGSLERAWNLEALWGVRLAGVPAEEIAWAFMLALFVGPIIRACSESHKMEHG